MESSSRRFCRTNIRRSLVPSCRCVFVKPRDEWSEALATAQLVAELACLFFSGYFADAHAIEHAVRRVILLNEDGRVGDTQAIAKAFGVGAFAESANLHGEKS